MLNIISSRQISGSRRPSCDRWLYIGGHRGLDRALGTLEQDRRIYIAKDIEEVTDSVREIFVDYIGRLSRQQDDAVLWYSSRMASRSISQSRMFQRYVYCKVLERISRRYETENLLFVTDDVDLLYVACSKFSQGMGFRERASLLLKHLGERMTGAYWIAKYLIFWVLFRFFRKKELEQFDVFIHSWVNANTFRKLPEFNDPHLGDLDASIQDKGGTVGRLLPLMVPVNILFKLNRHYSNIICPFGYLPFRGLLSTLAREFDLEMDDGRYGAEEDISLLRLLSRMEKDTENRTKVYLYYLLLYGSYQEIQPVLAEKVTFIYPFENQPWEKMLNLAFSDHGRIGYQHSTIPYNFLDYRTSRYEAPDRFLPQVVLSNGKKWTRFLEQNNPGMKVREAGAIRYSYLFEDDIEQEVAVSEKVVSVVLPIDPQVAVSLQKQVLRCLENGLLDEYRVKIKPHPFLMKSASLSRELGGYDNCEFVSEDLKSMLKTSEVLVTSGSTAVFEGVFTGVKTLYLVPEAFSWGYEHFIKDHVVKSYEEDFPGKLKSILADSGGPQVDIREFFSPPDHGIFLEYVFANGRGRDVCAGTKKDGC
ncbi:MAG: hypothetical protein GF409_04985 [Candidatus Omnitrophica bacterium]|nr:hypothetical protein [Candidatus Omnitrophota bacterium]